MAYNAIVIIRETRIDEFRKRRNCAQRDVHLAGVDRRAVIIVHHANNNN